RRRRCRVDVATAGVVAAGPRVGSGRARCCPAVPGCAPGQSGRVDGPHALVLLGDLARSDARHVPARGQRSLQTSGRRRHFLESCRSRCRSIRSRVADMIAVGAGLTLIDVRKSFDAFQLGPISCEFARGRAYGLLGPNGAGKTTLLNLVTLQSRLSGGSIAFDGVPVRWGDTAWKSRLSYIREVP